MTPLNARAARGVRSVTWPVGDASFAVDELLAVGRALDQVVREGLPVDIGRALWVVATLSAYVASLPAAEQAGVAKRLVEALNATTRSMRSRIEARGGGDGG